MRHFLDVTDLTVDELATVLDLAEAPSLPPVLQGKGVALIFEKPSNRTRQSMEMAVVQLGGHPVYTEGDHIGLDRREPVADVARVMAGYHAVLAIHAEGSLEAEKLQTFRAYDARDAIAYARRLAGLDP